jgi:hypothetical protein
MISTLSERQIPASGRCFIKSKIILSSLVEAKFNETGTLLKKWPSTAFADEGPRIIGARRVIADARL